MRIPGQYSGLCSAQSLLVARGFFFFGQRLVPNIFAESKARIRRFGFAFADFAALVQEFLNERIIGVLFLDMFHRRNLAGAPTRGNILTLPFLVALLPDPHQGAGAVFL